MKATKGVRSMIKFMSLLVLILFCFSPNVQALSRPSHFTADIYDLTGKDVKFRFEVNLETKGDTLIDHNTYFDAKGTPIITQLTIFKNEELVSFEQNQKQINTEGVIKIEGGKVLFSYTEDGKEKTDSEKLTPNFVTSPTLIEYMTRHWAQLTKGDSLDIRFGVIDRRETIGFTLKKDREDTFDGQKAVVIRMKPSSFVIAALVKPLYFTFNQDGSRALQLEGRLPVKIKDGNSWEDFDGKMVYHY